MVSKTLFGMTNWMWPTVNSTASKPPSASGRTFTAQPAADQFVSRSSNVLFGNSDNLPAPKNSAIAKVPVQFPPIPVKRITDDYLGWLKEIEDVRDGRSSKHAKPTPLINDYTFEDCSPDDVRAVRNVLLKAAKLVDPKQYAEEVYQNLLAQLADNQRRVNDTPYKSRSCTVLADYLKAERERASDLPVGELLRRGFNFIRDKRVEEKDPLIDEYLADHPEYTEAQKQEFAESARESHSRFEVHRLLDTLQNTLHRLPDGTKLDADRVYSSYLWNPLVALAYESNHPNIPAQVVLHNMYEEQIETWEERTSLCHAAMLENRDFYEDIERRYNNPPQGEEEHFARLGAVFAKDAELRSREARPRQLLFDLLRNPPFLNAPGEESVQKILSIMFATPDSVIRNEAIVVLSKMQKLAKPGAPLDVNAMLRPYKAWIRETLQHPGKTGGLDGKLRRPVTLDLLLNEFDDPLGALTFRLYLGSDPYKAAEQKVRLAAQSHPDPNVRIKAAWATRMESVVLSGDASIDRDLLDVYRKYREGDGQVMHRLVGQPIYTVLAKLGHEGVVDALQTRIRQHPPASHEERIQAFDALVSIVLRDHRQDTDLPYRDRVNQLKPVFLNDSDDKVFMGGVMSAARVAYTLAEDDHARPVEKANKEAWAAINRGDGSYDDVKAKEDAEREKYEASSRVDFLPKHMADLKPYQHRMKQLKVRYQPKGEEKPCAEYNVLSDIVKALDKL